MNPEVTKAILAAQERKWLLKSIESHLLPAFIQRGFTQEPRKALNPPIDRRYSLAFPLSNRVRIRESVTETVTIQLAPYRLNAFRINATTRPKEDGTRPFVRFEMYAFPRFFMFGWWSWFCVRPRPFRSSTQEDYDRLALRVAEYIPELDMALREGKLGPHLRRVVIPRPVVSSQKSVP